MVQTKAKIFLAEERGLNETNWFRSWNTFNFGKYKNENKKPFENIYLLNDDTLDGGRSMSMLIEEYSYVLLLPVVGAIAYKDPLGNENLAAAGQLQILILDKGDTFQITNPFQKEPINYLQIWIRADKELSVPVNSLTTYDVNEFQNCLLKISPQYLEGSTLPFDISIGKFSGRGEATYQVNNNCSNLFVFVIEGAFEVEGRLLHARDGLALSAIEYAAAEALSQDAILLTIELPVIF